MSEKYFGPGSTLVGDATGLTLFIPAATLLNPGLLDSPVGASEDKLAIAILNCLYSATNNSSDDATYLLVGDSVFPGRVNIGNPPAVFDTYQFSINVRIPSGSITELPDPDFS
jgi:hypothetical protein